MSTILLNEKLTRAEATAAVALLEAMQGHLAVTIGSFLTDDEQAALVKLRSMAGLSVVDD